MNFFKSVYLALFACMLFMGCASYEKDTFRTVSFNAAETHWRSVLPFEFIKDTDKNQWHDDENVVFQVSIFTVPEGKEHKAWMENIKKFFFDKQKNFSVISDHPVSFKNWHGTKIIIEQDPDICTYWFLSDGEFFMFVSLIDREFQGYHPKLSDIDDFFLYLERDNFSHSETRKVHFFICNENWQIQIPKNMDVTLNNNDLQLKNSNGNNLLVKFKKEKTLALCQERYDFLNREMPASFNLGEVVFENKKLGQWQASFYRNNTSIDHEFLGIAHNKNFLIVLSTISTDNISEEYLNGCSDIISSLQLVLKSQNGYLLHE